MKYKKKPIVIEAVQWFKDGDHKMVNRFAHSKTYTGSCNGCKQPLWAHGLIDTLEGEMRVCPGDWIIQGALDEFYPCKPAVFELTYDPVVTPTATPMIDLELKEGMTAE